MRFQISENNGTQFTNGELRLKTIRAAQNIRKLGYQPGDVIGIAARNSQHLAPIVFAAMSIGCPINALDPTFGKTEIAHMFRITKPKLIICDCSNVGIVASSVADAGLSAAFYTFDGPTEHSKAVDELLEETHVEEEFE